VGKQFMTLRIIFSYFWPIFELLLSNYKIIAELTSYFQKTPRLCICYVL
jgi:hypothetical protein